MNHDFRTDPDSEGAKAFLNWLEEETTKSLTQSRGDSERTKAEIFLFVNRAYEAHLPEEKIGQMFGTCLVRSGYTVGEEQPMLDWLEYFGEMAAGAHGAP